MNKRYSNVYIWMLAALMITGLIRVPLNAYERMDLLESPEVVIRFSNTTQFFKTLEESAPGRLWSSNEMKPFLNNQSLGTALKDALLNALLEGESNKKQLAHLYWEGLKLCRGELIIAFKPGKDDKSPLNFYIINSMSEEEFNKGLRLNERIAELDSDTESTRIVRFKGIPLYSTRSMEEGKPRVSWECFYKGTVLEADDREWVERCLLRLMEKTPDEPSGSPVLQVRLYNSFLKTMITPERQKTPAKGKDGENPGNNGPASGTFHAAPRPNPEKMFSALGLNDIKYISGQLILNPGSMAIQLRVKNKNSNPSIRSKGLWKVFSREPASPKNRLPYVPSDIYTYQVMRLDVNALWNELPEIIGGMEPKGGMYLNMLKQMFVKMYKVDLTRDVFGNFGTLVTTYGRMEGMRKQELFSWQLRDAGAIEKALAKIMGEGSPLKNRLAGLMEIHDLQGHKLYSVKSPAPPMPPNGKGNHGQLRRSSPDMGFAVVDNALVFGAEPLVRSHIQATASKHEDSPFYRSNEYKRMVKMIPENAVGYSVMDIGRLVRPVLEVFKSPMMLKFISMREQSYKKMAEGEAKMKPDALDEFVNNLKFEHLPPVDFITSFFGKGYSCTLIEGNDIVTRTTITYPPKQ